MIPGLVLLATAFILAPKGLWTGWVFDQRFAVLLALMLVANTRITKSAKGRESLILRAVPALLGLLFLARMEVLTSAWPHHRDDLAEMRRAIDLTTRGSRILLVLPDKEAGQRLAPPRHRRLSSSRATAKPANIDGRGRIGIRVDAPRPT